MRGREGPPRTAGLGRAAGGAPPLPPPLPPPEPPWGPDRSFPGASPGEKRGLLGAFLRPYRLLPAAFRGSPGPFEASPGFRGAGWGLTGASSGFDRRFLGSNRALLEASGGEAEPPRDLFGLLPGPPGPLKAFNGKNPPGSLRLGSLALEF